MSETISKNCNSCTKCCEGWLPANIRGHQMYKGKPCVFIQKDIGCIDYDNRPINPCQRFECEWIINDMYPEWMKPSNSGYIILSKTINNSIRYHTLVEASDEPDYKAMSWFIFNGMKNKLNIAWEIDNSYWWAGSDEFYDAMLKQHDGDK